MPSGRHAPSHGVRCSQEGALPLQGVIRAAEGINYPHTLLANARLLGRGEAGVGSISWLPSSPSGGHRGTAGALRACRLANPGEQEHMLK